MGVAVPLGLAEPDAVDDGRVVQRVGDDRVLLVEERLEQAAVGVEAGRVEDRVLGPEEARDGRLELLVDVLGAADEPDAREAEAPPLEPVPGGPDEVGVVGKAEVVVRAEVEDGRGRSTVIVAPWGLSMTRSCLVSPAASISSSSA